MHATAVVCVLETVQCSRFANVHDENRISCNQAQLKLKVLKLLYFSNFEMWTPDARQFLRANTVSSIHFSK